MSHRPPRRIRLWRRQKAIIVNQRNNKIVDIVISNEDYNSSIARCVRGMSAPIGGSQMHAIKRIFNFQ